MEGETGCLLKKQGFIVVAFKEGAVSLLILLLVMDSIMCDSETEIHPVTNFQYKEAL